MLTKLTDLLPLIYWDISPVAFALGPLSIRWYGIFFASGVFLFSKTIESDRRVAYVIPSARDQETMLAYAIFSTLLGAKLGYIALYAPKELWWQTLWTLQGFSFHGGLAGVILYVLYLAKTYKSQCLTLMDRFSVAIPWSLALGRIGNFFNSELIGRPTQAPWGILFPFAEHNPIPRYPSQLFECLGEGVLLGLLMHAIDKRLAHTPSGLRSCVFLIGYGLVRLLLERFRQPDPQIGLIYGGWTLGQILCAIMIAMGLCLSATLKIHRHFASPKGSTL